MTSKITTTLYSDTAPGVAAGTPASGCNAAISITTGNYICVAVRTLSEGLVKQLAVVQTSGTLVPFVVELLNSKVPYPVGLGSAAASGTIELYRVIPQQSITSGGALDLQPDYDVGFPFVNVDGNHTMNQRYLYLVIKPTGAGGTTKWDAALVVQSNNSP